MKNVNTTGSENFTSDYLNPSPTISQRKSQFYIQLQLEYKYITP